MDPRLFGIINNRFGGGDRDRNPRNPSGGFSGASGSTGGGEASSEGAAEEVPAPMIAPYLPQTPYSVPDIQTPNPIQLVQTNPKAPPLVAGGLPITEKYAQKNPMGSLITPVGNYAPQMVGPNGPQPIPSVQQAQQMPYFQQQFQQQNLANDPAFLRKVTNRVFGGGE
jgi:hypothetical protein